MHPPTSLVGAGLEPFAILLIVSDVDARVEEGGWGRESIKTKKLFFGKRGPGEQLLRSIVDAKTITQRHISLLKFHHTNVIKRQREWGGQGDL